MPLNIEPGLFEWLAWYQDILPMWMTLEELQEAGYNINMDYKPIIKVEEMTDVNESCENFYTRSAYISETVINKTQHQG